MSPRDLWHASSVAVLGLPALTLLGCDKVEVQRQVITLGTKRKGKLTDLSDVIQSLNFTVDEFEDASSGTTLRGVHMWNYQVPDLKVSPLTQDNSSFEVQVENVYADFHVVYLKAMAAGQAWEIESIYGVLKGRFRTVMSMDLDPPYALDFEECSATPEVTVRQLERKTWHAADYFGLGAIVNMKVKEALEDSAEKMFKQQLCGAYELSRPIEEMIDEALGEPKLGAADVELTREKPSNLYDWRDSRILRWVQKFNRNAHSNRFSIKGALQPFLDGLGTPEGHCLLGNQSDGCSLQVPEEVTALLNRTWNTTDGKKFNVHLENLELRLVDFTIPTVKLPQLNETDRQSIGFDMVVAPLDLKLQGDLVVRSDAYSAVCDIRKRVAVDFHFQTVAATGSFLVQVDADKYNALAPDQQAMLSCADGIVTDFRLQRFQPHISLERIGLFVSPDEDTNTSEKLVRALQEIVDNLIVTGISNSGEKIDNFLTVKTFDFISEYVNSKDGIGGLAKSLGQDLGDCPCMPSALEALGWATAAAAAFLTSGVALALERRSPKAAWPDAPCLRPGCLALSPLTPSQWRLAVPIFALGCIFLYLESNTGVAAVMTAFLTSTDLPDTEVYRLTEFGVVKSVFDLWNADMKGLALLLFTFSVVFPYVKLTLCLFCWLAPLRPILRGRILRVLNALARWSLLDACVLMTLMGLGSLETQMHGGISVSVFIDPRPSFVSFLVATILTFALGELILGCHEANLGHPEPGNKSGRRGSMPRVHLILLLSVVLLVTGCSLDVTAFEVQGLIGWFLNFLADDMDANKFSFSLFGLGTKLWNVTSDAHRWEAILMQVIFFLSAFVMNALFAIGALVFATTRLPDGVARLIRLCLPVVFACGAADVYVFGVILTVIETQQGSFVPTPTWLREQVAQTLRPKIQMPGASNDIIQIVPSVEIGAWLLSVATILFASAGHLFLERMGESEAAESEVDEEQTSTADEFTKGESSSGESNG